MQRLFGVKLVRLSVLAALLSGVQAVWEHSITMDYANHYFSSYFWIELLILIVILLSGLKRWAAWIIVFGLFFIEVVMFLRNELPFSPDQSMMLVVAVVRMIILVKAAARLRRLSVVRSTLS
jgi:peptidoglycan/LPS O-acetylase OafA/YrhL